jgi:hypothetical protein
MSQKRTVRCRRSAAEMKSGGEPAEAPGFVRPATPVPQRAQNLISGGFTVPHRMHLTGSAAPHAVQKFPPSMFSAWQRRHFMWYSLFVMRLNSLIHSAFFIG